MLLTAEPNLVLFSLYLIKLNVSFTRGEGKRSREDKPLSRRDRWWSDNRQVLSAGKIVVDQFFIEMASARALRQCGPDITALVDWA